MMRVDHMAIAFSRANKSPIVDTIQSLPQHQQVFKVLIFDEGAVRASDLKKGILTYAGLRDPTNRGL
ncbi:hypothetical protein L1987_17309 [Smallanthus sonchifolius]|uniref:Uncharacterized protein n=1 Tax=Smallanthus sonchifolius TaxID=185202 RepID=A0ACB9IYQ7_9ASTR|nr:hypothetical protein L1987_17309 [Smallanthus sonchifolius]